jgi:hypothetical protein
MTYKGTNKRDANEAEIVAFWRQVGCIWIPMKPGQGFDGLLIDRSGMYIVEIKNPEVSWHLTDDESCLSRAVEELWGEYHIVETLKSAAALIGLSID